MNGVMKSHLIRPFAAMMVFSAPFCAYAQEGGKKSNDRAQTKKNGEERVSLKSDNNKLTATFKLGEYSSARDLLDFDKDGWCDLWCAMHPEIKHRGKVTDSDGDGLTDYEEMVLMRNPMVKGPMPRHFTAEEIAAGKVKAKEAKKRFEKHLAERKKALAPLVQKKVQRFTKEERQAKRIAEAKTLTDESERQRGKAKRWMQQNRVVVPSGFDVERVYNGVPVVTGSFNQTGAAQIKTNEIQVGGSTMLDLTGDGFKIGMWDEGDVSNHIEISGRFTDKDGDVNMLGVDSHSNGVAGTMIGTGINPAAKGMSPLATVDAWDFIGDFPEIVDAAIVDPTEEANGEEALLLSNHSYGRVVGWSNSAFDFGTGIFRLTWFGDLALSDEESNYFGLYTAATQETDALVYNAPEFLQVWAAGNDRNNVQPVILQAEDTDGNGVLDPINYFFYAVQAGGLVVRNGTIPADAAKDGGFDTISADQVGKNVLSVGAVDTANALSSFTGFGPTDDGRIKPDIVAKGVDVFSSFSATNTGYDSDSGTSFAAPIVTGSINLLRELCSNLGRKPMLASTQKALVLHTATDLGNIGPDYKHGWGLMNTQACAELIQADSNFDSLPHLKEVFLPDGEFIEFKVKAIGGQPLKVSICWTDPAGTPVPGTILDTMGNPIPDTVLDPTDKMLVNDLDLRIEQGTNTFTPWKLDPANPNTAAITGDNDLDNVEQVIISNPVAGMEYTIRVNHKGNLVAPGNPTAGQTVSLIITGNEAENAPSFAIDHLEQTGTDEFTVCWSSVVGADYRVESSLDLNSWTSEGDVVNALREEIASEVPAPSANTKRFWRTIRLD